MRNPRIGLVGVSAAISLRTSRSVSAALCLRTSVTVTVWSVSAAIRLRTSRSVSAALRLRTSTSFRDYKSAFDGIDRKFRQNGYCDADGAS